MHLNRGRHFRKEQNNKAKIIGAISASVFVLISGYLAFASPEPPTRKTVEIEINLETRETNRRVVADALEPLEFKSSSLETDTLEITRLDEELSDQDVLARLSAASTEIQTIEQAGLNDMDVDGATMDGIDLSELEHIQPKAERRVVTVARGDVLMNLLLKQDIDRTDAHNAIRAMSKVFDPRRLRPGNQITVLFDHSGTNSTLTGIEIQPSKEHTIRVALNNETGKFEAKKIEQSTQMNLIATRGTINTSLYEAGAASGVPIDIMVSVIRIFSSEFDFKKDLKPGDSFEVMFERYTTPDGQIIRHGNVIYAGLTVGGQHKGVYRYTTSDGQIEYYDDDGDALGPSIMRRPVQNVRISSRFGMRYHPVLGTRRMHWGTDFAAPRGTPIMAAGDATIDYIGRKGASGNFIKLRHAGTLYTSYSHMSRFARGLKKGDRVRRGQIIGYIGSTGRSTGPHLHYEVVYNGKKVNALTADLPAGIPLDSNEMRAFQTVVTEVRDRFDKLRLRTEVAARNIARIEPANGSEVTAESNTDSDL